MFGFSIQKLLLLALVVGAVWYAFKWLGSRRGADTGAAPGAAPGPGGADLVACDACGTFVPENVQSCPEGRADCPMLKSRARDHGA